MSSCFDCEAGFQCPGNSSILEPCPVYKYCPSGSSNGEFCPNGTFGNQTGLSSEEQCLYCPTGFYCVDGDISAPCAPGYFCISGSNTSTPDGSEPTMGSLCPRGYYCPEGTLSPQRCDSGLVINIEGATSEADCTNCPAGFICTDTSTVPEPCKPGYYCPLLIGATPCPPGTWSDVSGATNKTTCLICPAGYWCPNEATSNPTINPCPIGHYCPRGTGGLETVNSTVEPIPCPSGTYQGDVAGESLSDCKLCPAGFYCPNATTVCFNCTDAAVRGDLFL